MAGFAYSIKNQFKGILFFFIAMMGIYVFKEPIFKVLSFFDGTKYELLYKLAVWMVLIGVSLILPLAVALQPKQPTEEA